jgi:hypothetical protein
MPFLSAYAYLGNMESERTLHVISGADGSEDFEVIVLFTRARETLQALKTAGKLANRRSRFR